MSSTIKDELRKHITENCWKPHPLVLDAADHIENLEGRIAELECQNAELRETLQSIVDADWRKWEELASPDEFVRWAKARATHALQAGKETKE